MEMKFFEDKYHEFFNITCSIGNGCTDLKKIVNGLIALEGIMNELFAELKKDPDFHFTRDEPNYRDSAWISDKGLYFPCNCYDHGKIATELAHHYYQVPITMSAPDEALLDHGWVKLWNHKIYCHTVPNRAQKETIATFLDEHHINEVRVNEYTYRSFQHYLDLME